MIHKSNLRVDEPRIPNRYILFILTVLCIVLMVVSIGTNILNEPLNMIAGYLVVPFQRGITSVGYWFNDRFENLADINILIEENKSLKEQLDVITTENVVLQQEKYELTRLRELYTLDNEYSDLNKIGAKIISSDSGNWFSGFVIDKGSSDGIKVGMNVIAGSGLVGIVVNVGPTFSTVTTIIDDRSNTSGMILATGDSLIVSGNLELMSKGVIEFGQLIDSEDVVAVGDKIVTSNISDKYLEGILIGYISTISTDSNNLTKSGTLTPAVDFEHLHEVLVITRLKENPQG